MTNLASTPSKHSEQSRYYSDRASAIRARLPTLQDDEVFSELYLLAAHYERLAEFAESSGSLASIKIDLLAVGLPGQQASCKTLEEKSDYR
jgi:hypothetical protein